jgi:predicted phosphate transport protein (TIGR00153 family)
MNDNGGNIMFFGQKKDVFFEKLLEIAVNLHEASKYYEEFKIQNASDLKTFSHEMKEYETKGDKFIHSLIVELNKTFITPIEREDILQLAMKMDDVLDGFEQCSARFEMYSITQADEYMVEFVAILEKAVEEILESVKLLSNKKLLEIRVHAIKIKDYESQCDELLRTSIKQLFMNQKDPIKIIQVKEMYEMFESIADSCQDVANTLEQIIMRNA